MVITNPAGNIIQIYHNYITPWITKIAQEILYYTVLLITGWYHDNDEQYEMRSFHFHIIMHHIISEIALRFGLCGFALVGISPGT